MMKKVLLIILILAATLTADAQIKFGYLSYDNALKNMPDYKVASLNLEKLRSQYSNETKRAENEFNEKYESFLEGQRDFAEPILKKRQAELQELLSKNEAFKKESDRLLLQTESDMYIPLYERLNAVLKRIGHERGYAFILNTDNNAVPFVNSAYGEDITTIVSDALRE